MKRDLFPNVIVALLVAMATVYPAAAQTRYTITNLGAETYPSDINDRGDATGSVSYPATRRSQAYSRAFIRGADGTTTGLGTFGGPTSVGRAINNNGQVVGWAEKSSLVDDYDAFLWEQGQLKELNTIAGPNGVSAASLGWRLKAAYAINHNGQIVGHGNYTRTDGCTAFLWERDVNGNVSVRPVGLGVPPYGDSETRGLNNLGQVSGAAPAAAVTAMPTSYTFRASLWDNGANTDIGWLPGSSSSNAFSINDMGQAVGFCGGNSTRAFLWDSISGIRPLGTLGGTSSNAFKINNRGQVVGWAYNAAGSDRAFVWQDTNGNGISDAGEMNDLNSLSNVGRDWVLKSARSINNKATAQQIIGNGTFKGKNHGFLLIPQ
nr:DUF3466 family protein [Armatimonas sp.]